MNFLRVTVHHYWNHKEIKNAVIPVIPATIFLFHNHLIKEAPQFSWGKHLIYSSGLSKQDIKWNNYFCLSIESDIVIKFGRRTWPCSRSFQYFWKTENQTKNNKISSKKKTALALPSTYFWATVLIYSPWKHQKIFALLGFFKGVQNGNNTDQKWITQTLIITQNGNIKF